MSIRHFSAHVLTVGVALAPEPGSLAVVALASLFWLGGHALRRGVSSARGYPRIREQTIHEA
jgi:hypothetical protein